MAQLSKGPESQGSSAHCTALAGNVESPVFSAGYFVFSDRPWSYLGPVSQKILSPLVFLSMGKTVVTMVISELKSISRLKIFRETEPWAAFISF